MGDIGVGLHLLIDGVAGRELRRGALADYILAVAKAIDMTIVLGPVVVDVNNGAQCIAIIAESHIMVKAMDDGRLYIDVFSCACYEASIPVAIAIDRLGMVEGFHVEAIYRAGVGPARKD